MSTQTNHQPEPPSAYTPTTGDSQQSSSVKAQPSTKDGQQSSPSAKTGATATCTTYTQERSRIISAGNRLEPKTLGIMLRATVDALMALGLLTVGRTVDGRVAIILNEGAWNERLEYVVEEAK